MTRLKRGVLMKNSSKAEDAVEVDVKVLQGGVRGEEGL